LAPDNWVRPEPAAAGRIGLGDAGFQHHMPTSANTEREPAVSWLLRSAIRDSHVQGLLPAAQRAEIWHGPVEPGELQQARDKPSRLPKRHAEEDLEREAGLNGRIRIDRLAAAFPVGAASHTIFGSNQTLSDPRCFSARL